MHMAGMTCPNGESVKAEEPASVTQMQALSGYMFSKFRAVNEANRCQLTDVNSCGRETKRAL